MTRPATVKRLEHVGVAVRSIARARILYEEMLGLEAEELEVLEDMKLHVLRLNAPNELAIELIEPQEGEETVSRYLEKNGEGIHHICFDVEDAAQATQSLIDKGYTPVWDAPKSGSHGKQVNFLRPGDTNGVLIEISSEE
jgi:methylmalonyl-CoA/ethylmalonyl-CoA epimerase